MQPFSRENNFSNCHVSPISSTEEFILKKPEESLVFGVI